MNTKRILRRVSAILFCFIFVISIVCVNAEPVSAATTTSTKFSYSSAYKSSKYYKQLKMVVLTGDQRKDLINIALSQVGYHEGNNKSGYSGTKSGSRNYTEYGRAVANSNLAWCGYFVSWCANQANISTSIIKKTGIPTAGSFGLKLRSKSSYKPIPGDLAFFSYRHVGIVYKVDAKYVYIIEGNAKNRVKILKYSLKSWEIKGYGVPNYSSKYKITYQLNGGTNNKNNVNYYSTSTTLAAPTRTGYVFGGWYANKSCTGERITKVTKKSLTVYAKWIPISYKISFDANGGEGTMDEITTAYNREVLLSANTFERENYYFVGWSTKSDASEPMFLDEDIVKNLSKKNGGKITLYAVWSCTNAHAASNESILIENEPEIEQESP